MKNLKNLSLSSIGALAFTLGSAIPSHAQTSQVETLANLNLRTGPSTSHSVILTIKKGTTVELVESSTPWSIVKYNGTVGYVSSQYIKQVQDEDKPSNDDKPSDTYTVMECNANVLNVRKGPSTSDKIIGKLEKTDRVSVVYQTEKGWSRIKYGDGYAYVSSKYLEKVNENSNKVTTMQCNTNVLNVRKGPSTSERTIGTLSYGDKVNVVVHLSNNWSKIEFNGEYAYVSTQYLSNSVSKPVNPNTMKCNATSLNVRKGPSTSEGIIGGLEKGDTVEVVYHLNSNWTRIKFDNGYGYVSSQYLTNI